MKDKLFTAATALPLSFLLGWGAMHCMISGLNLPVEDPGWLHGMWLLCALAGCLLFSIPSGGLIALTGSLAMGFWLWKTGGISIPIRALITRLSTIYNRAYNGWPVLEFHGVDWQATSLDLLLAAWGGLIILCAAAAFCRGRGTVPAALLSLLPLTASLIVNDTPPGALPLACLLAVLALMLLTQSVARQDPRQGARLAIIGALPTALVLGSLFWLSPRESYVSHAQEQLETFTAWWQDAIVSPFRREGGLGQTIAPTPTTSATTRLGSLGPRRVFPYKVMEVTADFDGTLYLRGQHYHSYDGKSWNAAVGRQERLPTGRAAYHRGTVTVETVRPLDVQYLPSYLGQSQILQDGRLENTEEKQTFTWSVTQLSLRDAMASSFYSPIDEVSLKSYLDLPEETVAWAQPYVYQILDENDLFMKLGYIPQDSVSTTIVSPDADPQPSKIPILDSRTVQAIIDHVANSALYDLDTPRMDGSYHDFAQWFLEESGTGYCVHFATAATVLLRAAGIPARYVTGYMVTCEEGKTVDVTSDQAHAWVEYYDEILGAWVVAEPTPPDLSGDEPETESVTAPTEETTAPTEAATEATQPTQAPTEATGPSRGGDSREEPSPSLWQVLRWFLLAAGLWLAVILQRLLRIALRRRTMAGGPNRRALGLWREVEGLSAMLQQEPPAELLELAQKAKFSQHKLTREELRRFTAWLKEARQTLNQRPLLQRLWCRYVLALW